MEIESIKMEGTEKQVAWAKKIIGYKSKGAKTCKIDDKEWEETVNWVSEKYGAKGWIDMRDDHPRSFVIEYKAAMIEEKEAEEAAKAAEQPANTTEQMAEEAVKQGINPEVMKKAAEVQKKIETATKPEQQKSIQTLVIPLIRDAANAAKRGSDKLAMDLLAQADEMMNDIITA